MNLSILNDSELKTFFQHGINYNTLKMIFASSEHLSKKIKGFRPTTVPKEILVTLSYNLVKKEKDRTLIGALNSIYDDFLSLIKKEEKNLIEDGYDADLAYSLAVVRNTNPLFAPIFYKLEGISEDEQLSIENTRSLNSVIISFDKKAAANNKEINKLYKDLKENLYKKTDIDRIIKDTCISFQKNIDELKEIVFELKNENTNVIKIDQCEQTLKSMQLKIGALESQLSNNLEKNKTIKELERKIDLLNAKIVEKNNNIKSIKCISISNNEYDASDDFFSECVGDVLESLCSGSVFDSIREYLTEIIFSKKPIICSENNSDQLANILSSIMTGGNYCIINLSKDDSDSDLIECFEKAPNYCENKIFIINNKINVTSHYELLNYIKTRPFTEKYIFTIPFEKELFFMPIESVDIFNFYLGKMPSGNIQYKYIYSFSNTNKKPIKNNNYSLFLSSNNLSFMNDELFSIKYYGILAYSIIPFLSIHSQSTKKDIINTILHPEYVKICEELLDE